ncbi:SDR family oxidoreductase [Dactylosporangium fulvum]|uniref:SDR family oxidoreductase n=1 Tax=Dactylosporangium fulvum TaxID=53359 RepID=A0ABY5VQ94_9ACTN|nr:SDR family NAD(P)-dependent oxidoreductase [Dactylosporangium fulvum]UWP78974.1 SDR family oxidoreductase [Dactylosporangium fulvum]
MTAPRPLGGKVAVVTGGATGIGAAVVARLADDGADVVLGALTAAEGEAAATRLRRDGREIVPVGADLATAEGCRTLIDAAVHHKGRIDILVNNAGITGPPAVAEFTEYDDARLDAVIDVNLKAPFRCARAAVPHMAPGSVIVNITSVAAYAAQVNASAYVAAKAGLAGLTRALGFELAGRGIRAVHVAPGDIQVQPDAPAAQPGPFDRRTPLGRRGDPAEVAAAVAWLCTVEAAFVTGTGLVVDGGWISY